MDVDFARVEISVAAWVTDLTRFFDAATNEVGVEA